MTTILGFGGSLREGSWNRSLLGLAAEMAPEGTEVDLSQVDVPRALAPFDQDAEKRDGAPPEIEELKDRLRAADGLLLATPEYNAGIPGFLKNAIDWASRPASDIPRVFGDLPVALIGAGGRGGTRFAQSAWLPILRYLQTRPWTGSLFFAVKSWELFDEQGRLTDEPTRDLLRGVVEGFADYCVRLPRTRAG